MRAAVACLLLWASIACAHEGEEPAPSCYVEAAREAWGALARFHGSPQRIVLAPRAEVKEAFYNEKPDPRGILIADDLTAEDLAAYTDLTYLGWRITDEYLVRQSIRLSYSTLVSIFAKNCAK